VRDVVTIAIRGVARGNRSDKTNLNESRERLDSFGGTGAPGKTGKAATIVKN